MKIIIRESDRSPILINDEQFSRLQEVIDEKKRILFEKQKKLATMSQQNCFLEGVKEDYNKYYTYIAQQKRDQIRALETLDNYINDLTKSGVLSQQNLEDTKYEQEKIMEEIASIKQNLETLINDTGFKNKF